MESPGICKHLLVMCVVLIASLASGPTCMAQTDTLRVGSVTTRSISAGVDTFELFDVKDGVRTLNRLSVVHRALESYEGRTVLRISSMDGRTRTEAHLDPRTLQVLKFRRVGAMDSTMFELHNNCFEGWSDLGGQPRRAIQCVRASDRFGSGALDPVVVGALSLKAGLNARVATFDAYGDITSFAIRVVQLDTISIGSRRFAAWRVERATVASVSNGGATTPSAVQVKTTWWVDASAPRTLQEQLTVAMQGTTRETLKVLKNP